MTETILTISIVLNVALGLIILTWYQFIVARYKTFFERARKVFNAHANRLDKEPKDVWDVIDYLDNELRYHKELCRKQFDEGDIK